MGDLELALGKLLGDLDFRGGPLFRLSPKLRLHSALAYDYADLGDEGLYLDRSLEMGLELFESLDFRGDFLLVYDAAFGSSPRELEFIESLLINPRKREFVDYQWSEDSEIYRGRRHIYLVEDFKREELFREIILSDFSGDYSLASSVFLVDLETGLVLYLYDDRGAYIMSSREPLLWQLWEANQDSFFEDCRDFEVELNHLFWLEGGFYLCAEFKMRINDSWLEVSTKADLAGLRLLRSLFEDHRAGCGLPLFPPCGDSPFYVDPDLDLAISHRDGLVTIEGEGLRTSFYYLQYKREILKLLVAIEDFYKDYGLKLEEIDDSDCLNFLGEWSDFKRANDNLNYYF